MIQKMKKLGIIWLCLCLLLGISGCDAVTIEFVTGETDHVNTVDVSKESNDSKTQKSEGRAIQTENEDFDLSNIPAYAGEPFVVVNNNLPYFTEDDYTETSYETYGDLDELGRCQTCIANIGVDLMPTQKRESISSVKPTGWKNKQYDFVDGKSLYNRCHLIGFQLTAENANEKNLITGTRYMNVDGMLPFENMVADYIKETQNHVLYRVTPIFEGDNLVASGVLMEAYSVEDEGEGICFNIYAYNVQPGVEINYADGSNEAAVLEAKDEAIESFVLNTGTKKYHRATCSSAIDMKEKNKQIYEGTRSVLEAQGYVPCGKCQP